jgi:hypothetical protein
MQIGQTGQFVPHQTNQPRVPAVIKDTDETAGTVGVTKLTNTPNGANDLPYVAVGGTPPEGVDYFQAI